MLFILFDSLMSGVDRTKVFTFPKYINSGRFFSRNNTQEVILGQKLAGDLGVNAGDTVPLNTHTRFEANNAVDFEVVGLLETPAPFINESGIFITFEAADQFLDVQDLVTELDIHVPWGKMEDVNAYVRRLNILRDKIFSVKPVTFTTKSGSLA